MATESKQKASNETFKYGIDDVADALKIKPASARVQLRSKGIKKAGKSYGWNSKAEVEEVVKKLAPKPTEAKKTATVKKITDVKKPTAKPAAKVTKAVAVKEVKKEAVQ